MALEGGPKGVTANCISEEVAELADFLCIPEASFVNGASLTWTADGRPAKAGRRKGVA